METNLGLGRSFYDQSQGEIFFRNSLNRRLYEEENEISKGEGRFGERSMACRLFEDQKLAREENLAQPGEKKSGFDRDDIRRI